MSLLSDIVNNKINIKNNNYEDEEEKKKAQKQLLQDVVNNRVTTQVESDSISSDIAARLGAYNRVTSTMGNIPDPTSFFDFSVSRKETEALRAYQSSKSSREDYIKAYTDYIKNPTSKNKATLDEHKKKYDKSQYKYYTSRDEAMKAIADEKYNKANPLYKGLIKAVEPVYNAIVDIASPLTTKKLQDEEGNVKYVNTISNQALQEKMTEKNETLGDKAYNFYNNVVNTLSKSIAAGATGGSILYFGDIALDTYQDARNEGNSAAQSGVYAGYSTLVAFALDKALGNTGRIVGFKGSAESSALEQAIEAGFNKLTNSQGLSHFASVAFENGLSEGFEEYLDNIGQFLMLNQDEKRSVESFGSMLKETLPNAFYSFVVGATVGEITDALDSNKKLTDTQKQSVKSLDKNTTALITDTISQIQDVKPTTPESATAKENILNVLEDTVSDIEKIKEANVDLKGVKIDKTPLTFDNKVQETVTDVKSVETNVKQEVDYKQLAKESGYSKQDSILAEKIQNDVIKISGNDIKKAKEISKIYAPPGKKQTVTKVKTPDGNTTTHYNPSNKIVSQGEKAVYDYVQNKVTTKELKEINRQDKAVSESLTKAIKSLRNKGLNNEADLLESKQNDFTYKRKHLGKQTQDIENKILNNIANGNTLIDEYISVLKEYSDASRNKTLFEIDENTNNPEKLLELTSKMYAIKNLMEEASVDGDSPIYSGEITNLQRVINMGEGGTHSAAQVMGLASAEARRNPNNIPRYAENQLFNMYEKIAEKKGSDFKWIEENNPFILENNSPFRFTADEYNKINSMSNELKSLDNDTFEYQKKVNEIDKYVGKILSNKLWNINKIKSIGSFTRDFIVNNIKQNNLLSFHVGFFNAASNVADTITLGTLKYGYENIAEKGLSKITGYKTTSHSVEGLGVHAKGVIDGLKSVGKTFITGVNNQESVKYFDNTIDFTKIGKMSKDMNANTFLGKILAAETNLKGRVTTAWMSIGDAPKSSGTEAASLFNMLRQRAINTSIENGKTSVFYRNVDEKSGVVSCYISDSNGNIKNENIKISNLDSYLKDKNIINATEIETRIAKLDGSRAVYESGLSFGKDKTKPNKFNQTANKFRDAFNSLIPGLGDTTLQFFNISNNVFAGVIRHTPLEIPELVSRTNTLKNNTEQIQSKIEKYYKQGDDYTKTTEYSNRMNENLQLQHDLAQCYGKVMAGSTMGIVGLLLATYGYITQDEEEKDNEKGIQDYSIKIGNKYFSYDFGLVGTTMKTLDSGIKAFSKENNIIDTATNLFDGFGNLMLEETYLSSLKDLLVSEYGDSFGDKIGDYLVNLGVSLTTPSLEKEISLALDDYTSRSTYSNDKWEYFINRMNAVYDRKSLPKKFDGWGNTMKKASNLIDSQWNTFFKSDFISTLKESSDVDNELAELYQMTGDISIMPVKSNGSYKNNKNGFSYNKVKYEFTSEEKAKFAETYGKTAYESIEKLIKTDEYKRAENEDKVKYISSLYTYAADVAKKEYLQTKAVEYYNTGKQVLILGTNDRFEQATILDAIDNNISYNSALKMHNNPDTYNYGKTITGNYDIYAAAQSKLDEIKNTYDNTTDRKKAYVDYVKNCSKLSGVQKAMLIKTQYSSLYKNYDEQIKKYLKSQNMSDNEYQKALDKMGIK